MTTTTTTTTNLTLSTTTSMASASELESLAFSATSGTTIRLPNTQFDLDVIQDMIAISADRLEGLRTQCVTSATLTQHEIRSLETKLVRMFSELLMSKARLNERIPANGLPNTTGNELKQWLRVVGLSNESLTVCLQRLSTLEQLMAQSDEEIKQLLSNNPQYKEEELRRLTKAMENLRKCKQYLTAQRANGSSSMVDITNVQDVRASSEQLMEHLYWDSWDRHHHHHHHHHHRGSMGNIGVSIGSSSPRLQRLLNKHQQQQLQQSSTLTKEMSNSSQHSPTLTPSPPNSPTSSSSLVFTGNVASGGIGGGSLNGTPQRQRPAGTPPPIRKHQTHQMTNAVKSMTPIHHAHHRPTTGGTISTAAAASATQSQVHNLHYSSTTLPLERSRSNDAPFHDSPLLSLASSPPSLTAIHSINPSSTTMSAQSISKATSRTRLHTDPSPESYSSSASSDIICVTDSNNINNNNNNNTNNISNNNHQSNNINNNSNTKINNSNNKNINNNNNNSHSNMSNSHMMSSNNMNNNNSSSHNLQVPQPRSPCTSAIITTLGMGHTISHRFTKVFKIMSCDLCQKQMFIGLKCKECKYRCHKDCEINVPPSCGLPREFVDEFKRTFKDQLASSGAASTGAAVGINNSPNLSMTPLGKKRLVGAIGKGADSSSPGSSCNSSTPSSPALFNLPQQQPPQHYHNQQHQYYQQILQGHQQQTSISNQMSSSAGGSSSTSSNMLSTPSSYYNKSTSQFNFPDVTITSSTSSNCAHNGGTIADNRQTIFSASINSGDLGENYGSSTELEAKSILIGDDAISNILTASYDSSIVNNNNYNYNMPMPMISTTSTSLQAVSTTAIKDKNTSSSNASISAVCTDSTTFYPRKLSSAGVDRRVPFTSSELSDTHKSNDSDKTVSQSGSTSASTDSDRTPRRLDSTEDGDSVNWPRQNSLSLKEWDIPYGDLRLLEQIGRGRFGTVHRALWHGDVAVKLLKEDYLHDEHMLEAFKLEVANFKKTRHENLVLFMGACMNPPYLAIVTSLCKGNTLYTYIHARRDKFTINKTTLVAQQISQGMGYLHARGIYHKDLRTKNIFLENGKVIITDFGLFSSTKLLYCDIGLGVPMGWLCYLAPELMRALQPSKPTGEVLPFSKASDVYSFGTVWYELLCSEFPFKSQPPEAIIWQVGRGMKQTLANLQTSRDVKDILMLCWHYQADDRPDFPKLLTLLERLPKKRLARSPSHPVQLSRSAESVF